MKLILTIIKNCTWKEILIFIFAGVFFPVTLLIVFILTTYAIWKDKQVTRRQQNERRKFN